MNFIFKTAGLCCVFGACCLAGAELERRMKLRWIFLRELCEFFVYLEQEMTYHRATILEAFETSLARSTPPLRRLLAHAAQQIREERQIPFSQIWNEASEQCITPYLLTREEYETLRESSCALCNTDTVMQRTLLQKYASRFRQMSEAEETVYREQGRLCRRLSAAAGIFAVILLI